VPACKLYNEHDINEKDLLRIGYKFLNGKISGDMTKDYGGKLDIDWIDGKIQVKSHYEDDSMYRTIPNIKRISQLINLAKILNNA